MSAQVTEAHRELIGRLQDMILKGYYGSAQEAVAESEAKACDQASAQVESLLSAAKNAIPASEHPAEPTVQNWAWQIRNLGDDRRLVYAERDQLRAELALLREWQREVIQNANAHHAERKDAIARAERAEAELKAEQDNSALAEIELKVSRAIVSKIWVQLGSPTYEQLKGRSIYDLIDEMKAELATERARLDYMSTRGFEHRHHETGDHLGYEWTISSYSESEDVTLRDVIDAEMREEAK